MNDHRSDELGALGTAVNDMAARLDGYVQGQKRFLADVAHETISPLARIQVGLGLLETKIDPSLRDNLRDVQDDAQQMAELLNELLLFSRAGIDAERQPPQTLTLRSLVMEVLEREDISATITVDVPQTLRVRAHAALLSRAMGNLIRNAGKHGAGNAIEIVARAQDRSTQLWVRDRGPGVSAPDLARLGQPFFRPDGSRSRDGGGYGLGLAIVRRCVEACGGSVTYRNRVGGGFEAEIHLPVAT